MDNKAVTMSKRNLLKFGNMSLSTTSNLEVLDQILWLVNVIRVIKSRAIMDVTNNTF